MANGKSILGKYRQASGVSKNLQKQMTNLSIGEIKKEEIGTKFSTGREIATNLYGAAVDIKGYLDERETAKQFKADLDIAVEAAPGVEKTESRFGVPKYQRKIIDKESKSGWKYEKVEPYKLYSEFQLGYQEDGRGYYDKSNVYMPPASVTPNNNKKDADPNPHRYPKTGINEKGGIKTTGELTVTGSGEDVTEPPKKIEDLLVDKMKESEEGFTMDDIWDEFNINEKEEEI